MPEPTSTFKPKKSVALSGVAAGNTAVCTVRRTGNDLSYRGCDIKDLAERGTFEEIAHLRAPTKTASRCQVVATSLYFEARSPSGCLFQHQGDGRLPFWFSGLSQSLHPRAASNEAEVN
jgi:hypothetical protein